MARITVEDCLEKVPNRFALVILATERCKQLINGSESLLPRKTGNKDCVNSLREIAAGKVRFVDSCEKNVNHVYPDYVMRGLPFNKTTFSGESSS